MTAHIAARLLLLLPSVVGFYSVAGQQEKYDAEANVIRSSVLALDRPKRGLEAIPQMTNTSSCEFTDTRNWVCRDGLTITGADSGKLHLYRLGPTNGSVYLSHAHLQNHRN